MQNTGYMVGNRILETRATIIELVAEAEDIRRNIISLIPSKTTNTEEVSTTENSRAASESPRYAPSITAMSNIELNSPAASTIYLRSRSRSCNQQSGTREQLLSSPLRRAMRLVTSSVHRKALMTIDKYGIDSVRCKNGFTALHWAYKVGNFEVVEYLLSVGADPNSRDSDGKLPRDYIKNDAVSQPQKTDNLHYKPLSELVHLQSLRDPHRKALEAIEKHGWSSVKWGGGWTILHWAFQENRQDVIQFCRMHGAPFDIRDENGRLPAEYRKP
jgi:hypothetical protein